MLSIAFACEISTLLSPRRCDAATLVLPHFLTVELKTLRPVAGWERLLRSTVKHVFTVNI